MKYSFIPVSLMAVFLVGCFPKDSDQPKALSIVSISPAVDDTDANATAPLTIKLSRDIEASTLSADQFEVTSSVTGLPVTGELNYDASTFEIEFTPDYYLAANTQYTVSLANGIKDSDDQSLASRSWSFTTNDDYRFEFRTVAENCNWPDCDTELWSWDEFGDAYLIADTNPNGGGSPETPSAQYKGLYYFNAEIDDEGTELWVTDGTPYYAELFMDLYPGTTGSNPSSFQEYNGYLYFSANADDGNGQLWRTDGTAAGTEKIYTPKPNGNAAISNLHVVNNKLIFTAYGIENNVDIGGELYVSDGTTEGTQLIQDLAENGTGSGAQNFTVLNDKLYFYGSDGNDTDTNAAHHSYSLFVTDGTVNDIQLVKDINPTENFSSEAGISNMQVFNNELFFTARDGVNGTQVWVSDGTEDGTHVLKTINGATGVSIRVTAQLDGYLYFIETNSSALWRTDGTEAGTVEIKQFDGIVDMEVIDAGLVISAALNNQTGLWLSDGTDAGTAFYFERSQVQWLVGSLGGVALFYENIDGETTYYYTDGTSNGTQKLLSENGQQFEYYDR